MSARLADFLTSGRLEPLYLGMPIEQTFEILEVEKPYPMPFKRRKNCFMRQQNLEYWSRWPQRDLMHLSLHFFVGPAAFQNEAEMEQALICYQENKGHQLDFPYVFRFSGYMPRFSSKIAEIEFFLKQNQIPYRFDSDCFLVEPEMKPHYTAIRISTEVETLIYFIGGRLARIACNQRSG